VSKRNKKKKNRRPKSKRVITTTGPLLSLAMMVKNEEDFLEDALKSAQPVCDELIVVDTGSTDRTVEIAQDLGATVSHFPWINDFSAARNETLKRANGQWVAILDADERFVGPRPASIRPYLKPGPSFPFQAFMLDVTNTRLDGSPISSFFSVRVFPRDPRLGYSGRVHNRFGALDSNAPKIDATRFTGLSIIHLGYDPELYKARQKAARSLPLIEATLRDEPDNHQQRFYLGREYLLLGRTEDAEAALRLAYSGIKTTGHGPLVDAADHLIRVLFAIDAPAHQIIEIAQDTLALHPNHPDIWYQLGKGLAKANANQQAAQAVERALQCLTLPGANEQVWLRHRVWEAQELLGALNWELARYQAAYSAYKQAFSGKPEASNGWPAMLNNLCALAIEFKDHEHLPAFFERLFKTDDAPLGMFFFHVNQVASTKGPDQAKTLLREAVTRCPRLSNDPEYQAVIGKIG
tara:strand:+ start:2168 stop:3562 length:1395 start_codon:yes stop_codon:yes gene_type:complete